MRKEETTDTQDLLRAIFTESASDLRPKLFDFGTERVIFHRGFRFTHDLEEDKYALHCISGESDMYLVLDDGELDVILDNGFVTGAGILQHRKCLHDIQRVTDLRASAIEEGNDNLAKKLGKHRKRLNDKLSDIKAFLSERQSKV